MYKNSKHSNTKSLINLCVLFCSKDFASSDARPDMWAFSTASSQWLNCLASHGVRFGLLIYKREAGYFTKLSLLPVRKGKVADLCNDDSSGDSEG